MNCEDLLKIYSKDDLKNVNFFIDFDNIIDQIGDPITCEFVHAMNDEIKGIIQKKVDEIRHLNSMITEQEFAAREKEYDTIREIVNNKYSPVLNDIVDRYSKFKFKLCLEMYRFVSSLSQI